MKKLYILFFLFQLYSLIGVAQCSYADFSYTTESDGCGIRFTEAGTVLSGNRTWDFGDGQSKIVPNATPFIHRYTQAGTYTVVLSAGSAKATKQVNVAKCGLLSISTIDCTINAPSAAALDIPFTATATALGGTPPYRYVFSGTDLVSQEGASATYKVTNNNITPRVNVTVYDVNNRTCSSGQEVRIAGSLPRLKIISYGDFIGGKPLAFSAYDQAYPSSLTGNEKDYKYVVTDDTGAEVKTDGVNLPDQNVFYHNILSGLDGKSKFYTVTLTITLSDGIKGVATATLVYPSTTPTPPTYPLNVTQVVWGDPSPTIFNVVGISTCKSVTIPVSLNVYLKNKRTGQPLTGAYDIWSYFYTDGTQIPDKFMDAKSSYQGVFNVRSVIAQFVASQTKPDDVLEVIVKQSSSCSTLPATLGTYAVKVVYKPLELGNISDVSTTSCAPAISIAQKYGYGASTYTWKARAYSSTGQDISDIFVSNSTNTNQVSLKSGHPYYNQFKGGETLKFFCDVEVRDGYGAKTTTQLVSMTLPLRIAATTFKSCSGTTSTSDLGRIAIGGISTYQYSFKNVVSMDALAATNLAKLVARTLPSAQSIVGTATLVVADGNTGCSVESPITLGINQNVAIAIIPASKSISLCSNGKRILENIISVSGGSGNYRYRWSPANYLDNPYIATPTIVSNPPAGTMFSVVVTDDSGCSASAEIPVGTTVSPNVSFTKSTDVSACYGISSPKWCPVIVNAASGYSYNYQWTSDDPLFNAVATNTAIYPLTGISNGFNISPDMSKVAGVYNFKIRVKEQTNGCIFEENVAYTIREQWKIQGFESETKAILAVPPGQRLPSWSTDINVITGAVFPLKMEYTRNGMKCRF